MLHSPWTAGTASVGLAIVIAALVSIPSRGSQGEAEASVAALTRDDQLPRTNRAAKADRLQVSPLAAITGSIPAHAPVARPPQVAALGYVDPSLYASDPGSLARILLDGHRIGLSMDPPATDAEDEAADDAIEHAEPMPVPRMKPVIAAPAPKPGGDARRASLASLAAPGGSAGPVRGSLYAALPSPNPSLAARPAAPSAPARGTIPLDTPFGVPYIAQTESVETACLRPELLSLLRKFEQNYHQKVVITSGQRSRGRDGSLHRTCSAADIIVPGVDASALAAFARKIPGIGGVGTYCHPNMIHVDVGSPRDWSFCGGRNYFAMRDGSKVAGMMTE